jgi:hypothetical protein
MWLGTARPRHESHAFESRAVSQDVFSWVGVSLTPTQEAKIRGESPKQNKKDAFYLREMAASAASAPHPPTLPPLG